MYNVHAQYWAPGQLLTGCVYRVDSRPPAVIGRYGFEGTLDDMHTFAAFEHHTVFASLTIEGASTFQLVMYDAGIVLPFLYRINVTGLRGYVFKTHHDSDDNLESASRLARIRFERYKEESINTPEYQLYGQKYFVNDLAETLALGIEIGFLPVNEVHIQAPIAASRITPCLSWPDEIPASPAKQQPSIRRCSF